MAYRVNPYVENPAYFEVAPTKTQPQNLPPSRVYPVPLRHDEPVPRAEPKVPSRVIPVVLDSKDAINIVNNEVTYNLNMPHLGKLKPGTVLYVRAIETNQTEICDWAISGLNTWSFSLNSATLYGLRARFLQSGSQVYTPQGGLTVPLCVSLKSEDVFFNNRLVLTRLDATGTNLQNIPNFFCRLHLLFKEPEKILGT